MFLDLDVNVSLPETIAKIFVAKNLRTFQGATIWKERSEDIADDALLPIERRVFGNDDATKPVWNERIRAGSQVPIIRLGESRMHCSALTWGRRQNHWEPPELSRSALQLTCAWRCLVPAVAFHQMCDTEAFAGSRIRYALLGPSESMIGGVWLAPQSGPPTTFLILTTPSGPELSPYCSEQPLAIHQRDWAKWLDPLEDGRNFQRRPAREAFKIVGDDWLPEGLRDGTSTARAA